MEPKSNIKLIVGIIIALVVIVGVSFAYYQVKNNESAGSNNSVATTTETTSINFKDNGVTINDNTVINNKISFTPAQLSNLKTDLTQLYVKYNGQDKNIEPLKTQFGLELNAIFLRDLGVNNVTTENLGILLYPEIASIMSDIKNQYNNAASSAGTNTVAPIKNVNTQNSLNVPTITYTVNGLTNLNVNVGDKITAVWSSTNADSISYSRSFTGCPDSRSNMTQENTMDRLSGSESAVVPANFSGCTYTETYIVKNTTTGKQATATVIMKIK